MAAVACPYRKWGFLSPKLTAKQNPTGQKPFQHEITQKIWQINLWFFEELQQKAGLKVGTYKFFGITVAQLTILTRKLHINPSDVNYILLAAGVKGLLIKVGFLPKICHFQNSFCCPARLVKQAHKQPSKMPWHWHSPSYRPLYLKGKEKHLLSTFKRCLPLKTGFEWQSATTHHLQTSQPNPALGKQLSRDRPTDVPTTHTLPNANLLCQKALD